MTTPIDHPGALRGDPTWPARGTSPQLTTASPAIRPVSLVPAIDHTPKEYFYVYLPLFPSYASLVLSICPEGKRKKRYYYLRPEPQGPKKQSAHIARAQVHGDNHQST